MTGAMEGINAAIEGTIVTSETKLEVAQFSPNVALTSTSATSSIVQTLELSQLLAAIGASNARFKWFAKQCKPRSHLKTSTR